MVGAALLKTLSKPIALGNRGHLLGGGRLSEDCSKDASWAGAHGVNKNELLEGRWMLLLREMVRVNVGMGC